MSYIGNSLQTAQPNYKIIDDISGSFNGVTTSFALLVGGLVPAPFPVSSQHCLISVGGVLQEPDPTGSAGYLLSGNNIVFSAAPSSGQSFFGTVLAGADYINVGGSFPDGTVSQPSITFDSDLNTGIFRSGADQLSITTSGTNRVTVNSSGNVGIGNTAMSSLADNDANDLVVGPGNANAGITVYTGTGNYGSLTFADGTSGDQDYRGSVVYHHNGDSMRFNTAASERLRILSDGTIATAALTATPGTVAAGSYIQHAANAGFFGNNGDAKFGSSANNPVLFQVNGSEKARIDTSGRLLLATTTAGYATFGDALTIERPTHCGMTLRGGTTSDTEIFFADGTTGAARYAGGIRYAHNTDHMQFTVNGAERVRIDTSGSVGIGISNPGAYHASANSLVTSGGITLANTSQGSIFFADSATGTGEYVGQISYSHTSDFMLFVTNTVERMRINSLGKVGIMAQANSDALAISSGQSSGTSYEYMRGMYGSTTAYAGTLSFRVFTNGNVQNTNNSYGQISDVKLKENIVDANSQWNDIKAVQVRNFNFKEETGNPTHTQIGVVAQELETVSPGLVYEIPDRDAEGKDLGTVTKAVNYSVLYMKAVKALQEAIAKIETLETKVAALEAG